MYLRIKIYDLVSFVMYLHCSVKESDQVSNFKVFKSIYYENLDKKFEDNHSIYIKMSCCRPVPHNTKNWNESHVFYLSFRLAKEEVIESKISENYPSYVRGVDYPNNKYIKVPSAVLKEFYMEMKEKNKNFGFKPSCCPFTMLSITHYEFRVYLKREEATILINKINKHYDVIYL